MLAGWAGITGSRPERDGDPAQGPGDELVLMPESSGGCDQPVREDGSGYRLYVVGGDVGPAGTRGPSLGAPHEDEGSP